MFQVKTVRLTLSVHKYLVRLLRNFQIKKNVENINRCSILHFTTEKETKNSKECIVALDFFFPIYIFLSQKEKKT